jgi:ferredoxin-NADP reductase
VNAVRPGQQAEMELPLGGYALAKNQHRKVFIATGTGLAPYLPKFQQLQRERGAETAELYFGCRTRAEDITANFREVLPRTTPCICREDPGPNGFKGRVSQLAAQLPFEPDTTDFYLCRSAAMVSDCRTVLKRAGAIHLYVEAYRS